MNISKKTLLGVLIISVVLFVTVFGISMLVQMVIFYKTKQPFLFMQMVAILLFNVYNYWSWTAQGIG